MASHSPSRRRVTRGLAGLAVAGALLSSLAVALPAEALGAGTRQCYNPGTVYGNSAASGAATSVTAGVPDCGSAMARVRTGIGWTIWYYSNTTAWAPTPSGHTAINGGHSVDLPAPIYAGNFPFTT